MSRSSNARIDASLHDIALHSILTATELHEAGLDRYAIARRVRTRRLLELFRGVYSLGPPTPLGTLLAAARTYDGHVTGVSALGLWRIFEPPPDEPVHVAATRQGARERPGTKRHVTRELPREEQRLRYGIPVVSPARALLDFAADARPAALEQAVAEAHYLRLAREDELRAVLERHPRRPGSRALRTVLGQGARRTRSEAERRLLELVRAAELPGPETGRFIAGWPADLLWAEPRLVVEIDGYDGHSGRQAFKRDRRRDGAQIAAGYVVLRIDADDVFDRPEFVVALVAQALAVQGAFEGRAR